MDTDSSAKFIVKREGLGRLYAVGGDGLSKAIEEFAKVGAELISTRDYFHSMSNEESYAIIDFIFHANSWVQETVLTAPGMPFLIVRASPF